MTTDTQSRARRAYRWLAESGYRTAHQRRRMLERELARLSDIPRRTAATTSLLGRPLTLVDAASFLAQYRTIIHEEQYRFVATSPSPIIVDCGAGIGLSTIYWKSLHPHSRVTAFEPDPNAFAALVRNVESFGLSGVTVLDCAVWVTDGVMSFWTEGADAGRLLPRPMDLVPQTTVRTVRLREYLKGQVDLLKLDIEGAEVEVLRDCEDLLPSVQNLIVEYHSFSGVPQRLDEVFRILTGAGFRLHVTPEFTSSQPLVDRKDHLGMDLQLNIFGFRS